MFQRTLPVWCLTAVVLSFTGCCSTRSCMWDGMAGGDCCGLEGGSGPGCGAGALHGRPGAGPVRSALGCSSGGGEVYWGEWCNDPPGCDPCDGCGNWTGYGGCCHPFRWLAGLWGYRYHPGIYDGAYESWDSMPAMEGGEIQEYLESPLEMKAAPKASPEPSPAANKQASAKRGSRYVKYSSASGQTVRRQLKP